MHKETLTNALGRLLNGPVIRGLISAFALKGTTVLMTFGLIALAAWELDGYDFGLFSMLYSAAGLFALLSNSGQQTLVVRSWNEYAADGDAARLKGALLFGLLIFLGGLLLVSAGFLLVLGQFQSWPLAWAVTAYMFVLGVNHFTGHLVRAAVGVAAGDGLGPILMLALPIADLVGSGFIGRPVGLTEIFVLLPVGGLIAVLVHLVLMSRQIDRLFPAFWSTPALVERSTLWIRSVKLGLFNILEAVNQFLDVLLVGLLLSPTAAGAYFVVTRLANIFTVAWGATYFYVSRHVPRLYFRRELEQLDHHLNVLAAVILALIVGGLALMIVGGPLLLTVFSPEYVAYAPALAVLSLGTAAVLAAGASGPLLTFIGHEGRALQIHVIVVAARLSGFMLLIPLFQINGAVAATTLSFILMFVLLHQAALKLTGIDGTVLRLLAFLPKVRVPVTTK